MNRLVVLVGALGIALAAQSSPATAVLGTPASAPTAIHLPGLPGYHDTTPAAINDHGLVVGQATWPLDDTGAVTVPARRPVVWIDREIATLPVPAGLDEGIATAVNNRGVIVGEATLGGVSPVPVRWVDGVPQLLPLLPGHTTGTATGINDLGEVIGVSAADYVSPNVPVVWRRGVPEPLPGTDQWTRGAPVAINVHGTVIGWMAAYQQIGGGYLKWERREPPTVFIDFEDGIRTVEDVNDRGVVVGSSWVVLHHEEPLVWRGGRMSALPNPPHMQGEAQAVNLRGDVAGWAYDSERRRHPVLWRDGVPELLVEPASAAGGFAVDINRSGVIVGVEETTLIGRPRELPLMWAITG